MALTLRCPSCSARLEFQESALNKAKKCPRCRTAIYVMQPPGAASPSLEPRPLDTRPEKPSSERAEEFADVCIEEPQPFSRARRFVSRGVRTILDGFEHLKGSVTTSLAGRSSRRVADSAASIRNPPPLPTKNDRRPFAQLAASLVGRLRRRKTAVAGASVGTALLLLLIVAAADRKPAFNPADKDLPTGAERFSSSSTAYAPYERYSPPPSSTFVPTIPPAGPITYTDTGISYGAPSTSAAPANVPYTTFSVDPGRRQFLQQETARLQAAIQQDDALLQKNRIATGLIKGFGDGLYEAGRRSDDRGDAFLGTAFKGVTDKVSGESDRFYAGVLARFNANQQLLQQYQSELNSLPAL